MWYTPFGAYSGAPCLGLQQAHFMIKSLNVNLVKEGWLSNKLLTLAHNGLTTAANRTSGIGLTYLQRNRVTFGFQGHDPLRVMTRLGPKIQQAWACPCAVHHYYPALKQASQPNNELGEGSVCRCEVHPYLQSNSTSHPHRSPLISSRAHLPPTPRSTPSPLRAPLLPP